MLTVQNAIAVVGSSAADLVPLGQALAPHLPEAQIVSVQAPDAAGPGWQLSGGEQQMLAIGRALMTNPRLLVLDEATEGLAPVIREEIWRTLGELKREGLAWIVIDKNIGHLLRLADRHYVIEQGHIVWQGSSDELRAQPDVVHQYLGV